MTDTDRPQMAHSPDRAARQSKTERLSADFMKSGVAHRTKAGPRDHPSQFSGTPSDSPVSVFAVRVADSGGSFFTVVHRSEVTVVD
jgi:hypothetical protein